ncbi:hypothetical protein D3C72_635080 [compost metagenome]
MFWSRKNNTLCLSHSSRICAISSGSWAASARLILLSSAPMAGEQICTLIECWRTDDRIMAGAEGVRGEGASWVAATFVIVVSNPCCTAVRNMCIRYR